MKYDPRKYWPDRLRKKGKAYVAWKSKKSSFDKQARVFWEAIASLLPEGGRVLDFGCGVGRFSAALAASAEEYEGVDLNEDALRLAPEIENASFTYLNEDRLPFDDDVFDGAVALTVIQHIVDDESFSLWTRELARVIKPGGFFIGIETPELSLKLAPHGPAFHMKWRTAEIISNALGGEVEEQFMVSAEFTNSHYCFRTRL